MLDTNPSKNPQVSQFSVFIPDPAKSQVPFPLTAGTKLLKRNPSGAELAAGAIDIAGWVGVCIRPSTTSLNRYFNGESTKTRTVPGGQDTAIPIHSDVASITISGTDPSIEVEGM